MFALSSEFESLSPTVMKFGGHWLYDLRTFHSFWKDRLLARDDLLTAPCEWELLLKKYRIQTFSAITSVADFARDYHAHYQNDVSSKNFEKVFKIFANLGVRKVGHLERIPPEQLQKRLGVVWGKFFRGVLRPEQTPWVWQPYRWQEPIRCKVEFDLLTTDALWLLAQLQPELEAAATKNPYLHLEKLRIRFGLYDWPEKHVEMEIPFTHRPLFQKELPWILRILQERFLSLELPERVEVLHVELWPSPPKPALQLSLFHNPLEQKKLIELFQKLWDQDFKIFQPLPTACYTPEQSWKKSSPLQILNWMDPLANSTCGTVHGSMRPLLQESIRTIETPEGALYFTECLQWFDSQGQRQERNYYMTRHREGWIWVFQDQSKHWFRQGMIE